jgi:hypothetical protein
MLGRFANHSLEITVLFLAHVHVLRCCWEPPQQSITSSLARGTVLNPPLSTVDSTHLRTASALYTSSKCSRKFSTDPTNAGMFHSWSCDVIRKPPIPLTSRSSRHRRDGGGGGGVITGMLSGATVTSGPDNMFQERATFSGITYLLIWGQY